MLNQLQNLKTTERMPVVFIGHGSPMNAIETNNYTRFLNKLGKRLPTPKAILVVSAHWMTRGTQVTAMEKPKTIHDFYGFPKPLFDVQYPAPGSPEVALAVHKMKPDVRQDFVDWGLDHGTWAVLRHIYPDANIPVLQLSLDMTQPVEKHLQIGAELSSLRDRGVLILGSGNLVHNLRMISWDPTSKPMDWAVEFDQWIAKKIESRDFAATAKDFHNSAAGKLAVPTLDHYLPLHYVLGASDAKDALKTEYEEMQNGSISMRSISFGLSA